MSRVMLQLYHYTPSHMTTLSINFHHTKHQSSSLKVFGPFRVSLEHFPAKGFKIISLQMDKVVTKVLLIVIQISIDGKSSLTEISFLLSSKSARIGKRLSFKNVRCSVSTPTWPCRYSSEASAMITPVIPPICNGQKTNHLGIIQEMVQELWGQFSAGIKIRDMVN